MCSKKPQKFRSILKTILSALTTEFPGSERAREAAHGGEAVPVLAVRGQLHLDARHRAAHARRPRRRAQGRQARVVQEDGEAAIQVIQGCREVQ